MRPIGTENVQVTIHCGDLTTTTTVRLKATGEEIQKLLERLWRRTVIQGNRREVRYRPGGRRSSRIDYRTADVSEGDFADQLSGSVERRQDGPHRDTRRRESEPRKGRMACLCPYERLSMRHVVSQI